MSSSSARPKVIVVGGVAGGASCATRLRRLTDSCDITLVDRGQFVSFANCGLPYYVSGDITRRDSLIVATPELFKVHFVVAVL